MRPAPLTAPHRRAFTLVELMVTITIVALLTVMAFEGYSIWVRKAESVACVKKIANFGKGLQGHVTEFNQWPQEETMPGYNAGSPDEDRLWDWWYQTLKKQGIGVDDWYCPSDIALRKQEEEVDEKEGKTEGGFRGAIRNPSYIPAKFGPGPYAPYEVPNHPWAIESRGHYDGTNKVMPNGTVQKEMNFKAVRVPAGGNK